ncbi:MAG: MOSC domain-containing protein [Bacteroidota bacterium]|nr:MOSC domain-containing protein [Kiloniellaceae bacterium]
MTATVQQLCRYPVKGLNAEVLERVALTAGEGLPDDRRFGVAYGLGTGARRGFFDLVGEERLAQLRVAYDPAGPTITLSRQGRQVVSANPADQTGRMLLSQFFAGFLAGSARGTPSFQEAGEETRAALLPNPVSILNLASIRDLERVARQPVDPRRFRGNIIIDGLPAWAEFGWLGREIRIGQARLKVVERIQRCAATNVNPDSAERDMNIPLTLRKGFGHIDMGVYAAVMADGEVNTGDLVAEA